MKILASKQYSSEILKVMHKRITTKFGNICKLGDLLTFYTEEDFNKFKNHFGFTGKVEPYYSIFRTENKYIDIYYMININKSYGVYLKGSTISGKDIYVLKLDKIFKSLGAESSNQNGYRVNEFDKAYNTDKISQMLEGEFNGVKGWRISKSDGVIELACGLRVKVNEFNSSTTITYETL